MNSLSRLDDSPLSARNLLEPLDARVEDFEPNEANNRAYSGAYVVAIYHKLAFVATYKCDNRRLKL